MTVTAEKIDLTNSIITASSVTLTVSGSASVGPMSVVKFRDWAMIDADTFELSNNLIEVRVGGAACDAYRMSVASGSRGSERLL